MDIEILPSTKNKKYCRFNVITRGIDTNFQGNNGFGGVNETFFSLTISTISYFPTTRLFPQAMLIRGEKRNAGRAIVLDYSTTDPIADPRYSGVKPSKNPDYKVTNTIFLPTGRSGLETFRFLTVALIKIRNPRFHGSRCTREHTPRNFTANYSFNSKRGKRERERAPRQKRLNLRRNPSCCLLVGQLCCA